ncbi:MAG: MaoC family dehydratase [Kaistella sp.]|nr:MaoC family dehydratase [Kaistella sp.]
MNNYLGKTAHFSKTLSETDLYLYAGITGDLNPVHVDEEYAKKTKFKKRIAHGLLTASYICMPLGMYLPGPGTIQISQFLDFVRPVYIGDTISVHLEVTEILEKGRLKIRTLLKNQNEEIVIDGYAIVIPPRKTDHEIQ